MSTADIQLSSLLIDLRKACLGSLTGNFYFFAENGSMIQFSICKGDIVYIFYDGKRGESALLAASLVMWKRGKFVAGAVKPSRKHQISTDEILSILENYSEQRRIKPSPRISSFVKPGLTPPEEHLHLTDRIRNIINEELTEQMGPFAEIICAERLARANDLESAIKYLSSELPRANRALFEQRVRNRLNKC